MPIQILHAADFHLDAPFSSLSAEQAAERREEQRELLARLAELARSRGADLERAVRFGLAALEHREEPMA